MLNTIERINRIHKLIQRKATGNPDEFADKLHLKKRQLYNILDEFKSYGASIKFNRSGNTYYYANNFEIMIKINTDNL